MNTTSSPNELDRGYKRISTEALNALIDMIDRRSSGMVEVHFSNGGIAKVYSTEKKTYK